MTIGDRAGLIDRIREIRSRAVVEPPTAELDRPEQLQALEARVLYLEQLLEGLQDSVHRESERQSRLIAEVRAQIHPSAMRTALAEEARSRGF